MLWKNAMGYAMDYCKDKMQVTKCKIKAKREAERAKCKGLNPNNDC